MTAVIIAAVAIFIRRRRASSNEYQYTERSSLKILSVNEIPDDHLEINFQEIEKVRELGKGTLILC